VLLVSADLDELRALCNRLLVMSRGQIVLETSPDASDLLIGELAPHEAAQPRIVIDGHAWSLQAGGPGARLRWVVRTRIDR